MLSIGILFLTSPVGAVLPSPSPISVNWIASRTPFTSVKGANIGHINVSSRMPALGIGKSNLLVSALIPSNLLPKQEDGKSSPSLPDGNNPTIKTNQNQFCRVRDKQNPISSVEPQATAILTNPKQIKVDFWDISSISHQILRSLQTLFRLSRPVEKKISFLTTPAVAINRDNRNFEVWLNNSFIATLPSKTLATDLKVRLNRLLKESDFHASQLVPRIVDGMPSLMSGNRVLFQITEAAKQQTTRSVDLLAIEWVNNLRMAMQAPTLSLVQAQAQMYGLTPTSKRLSGLASWYGPYFHGRKTANGEIFNQHDLTVAHKSLPFNTFLNVRNVQNGKSVIVRVNDRGPFIPPRSLDLSKVAARCIHGEQAGVVSYEATIMNATRPSLTMNPEGFEDKFRRRRQKPRQIAVVSEF